MADENLKSTIPVEELVLTNGETVRFYSYLTTGESRRIQKLMLENGKMNPETGKLESLSVSTFLDVQELAATFVVKNIKVIDGTEKPFAKEWLDNLPAEVGNEVYEKVNLITQVSHLNKETKKG